MAQIGVIQKQCSDKEDSFSISYLTPEVNKVLHLPSFSSVTEWSKKLGGLYFYEPTCVFGLWKRLMF